MVRRKKEYSTSYLTSGPHGTGRSDTHHPCHGSDVTGLIPMYCTSTDEDTRVEPRNHVPVPEFPSDGNGEGQYQGRTDGTVGFSGTGDEGRLERINVT